MTMNTQVAIWPQRPHTSHSERPKNFVFLDLETTGLDRDFDQIQQVVAIKTDAEFNIIDELTDICNIRCRRLPWIVPDPAALLTTRTDPVFLDEENMLPQEAMQRLARMFEEWSPAVFIGYNSTKFDDEFLRRGFFSALQNPYLTQSNGSMRADLMAIAHAIHAIAPDRINVPLVVDGEGKSKPSFRLVALAKANGVDVDESDAHDAMVDVLATIALAKALRQAAPEIFNFMLGNSNKWNVIEMLERSSKLDPVTGAVHPLALLSVIGGKTVAKPIMGLFPSTSQLGRIITADITIDPDRYLDLNEEELASFIKEDRWRFPALKANAQPILMPTRESDNKLWISLQSALPEAFIIEADWCSDSIAQLIAERMRQIMAAGDTFKMRLTAALAMAQPIYPEPAEVEQQLYSGGFISRQDAALASRISLMPVAQRAEQAKLLSDPRLREHTLRWVFASEPETLPQSDRERMQALVQARLLGPIDQPWRTIAKAREDLLRLTINQSVERDAESIARMNRIALWLHNLEQQALRASVTSISLTTVSPGPASHADDSDTS